MSAIFCFSMSADQEDLSFRSYLPSDYADQQLNNSHSNQDRICLEKSYKCMVCIHENNF